MQVPGDSILKVHVHNDQKARILNLDKTAITLDGSKSYRGGRPSMAFVDGGLPEIGLSASKMSQSTTMITKSNALGEVIPPHFQFSTIAKSDNGECIWLKTLKYLKGFWAKFGMDLVMTRRNFSFTLRLNEKGGTDREEFEKYIFHGIVPLFQMHSMFKGNKCWLKLTPD